MSRWLPWIGSAALVAVAGGAVYMTTVGLDDAQAATIDYITQAAEQTDVTVTSAASGNIASAASYSLAFGSEPSLDGTTATSDVDWSVVDVLVSEGDTVSAGQALAVADTGDLESQVAALELSLAQAKLTLAEARAERASAPDRTKDELASVKANIKSLKAQLKEARKTRDNATAGSTAKAQAKLQITDLKAQLESAREQRAELKAERRQGYPSLSLAVDMARQDVADLASQLADLEAEAELATIVAPVDGVVSELNISAGFSAPSGAAVVVDSDTLEVVASVVESDIGSLVVGQAASVSIDAVEQEVAGVVTSVVPTTSGSTSSVVSYPVTVTLTDPDASVLSGMSSDVEIVIDEATDVVAVPVTALSGRDGDYTVAVVADDGSTEVRAVTVGLVTETLAEIESGLAAGEEVVVGTTSDRTASDDEDEGQDAFGGGFPGGGFDGGPPAGGGFPGGGPRDQ